MELFVCKAEIDYEGFEILGIYDSIEKAEKRIKTIKENNKVNGCLGADDYSIKKIILNEDLE